MFLPPDFRQASSHFSFGCLTSTRRSQTTPPAHATPMARTKAQALADGTYRARVMTTSRKPRASQKEQLRTTKLKESIGGKSKNGIIGATKLTQLERIMDGWFKQESDAATTINRELEMRNRELDLQLDLRQSSIRRLRREITQFQVVNEHMVQQSQQLIDILGEIFVNQPAIRDQYAGNPLLREFFIFVDDPAHPNFVPPEFLANEDTEVESIADSEVSTDLENFEHPGRLRDDDRE